MSVRRWLAGLGMAVLLTAVLVVTARCRVARVVPAARLAAYDDTAYASVLTACVRDGLVDYETLRSTHAEELGRYVDAVGRFGPTSTPDTMRGEEDRLAYHLNAYNAIMLRRWLDAGAGVPRDAQRSVNRLWFVFDQWRVDGHWVSLDTLEQRIIRPTFDEPRVHFALVCGAMGCPPLLEEPFAGARIDEQLDGLARRWLREPDALQLADDGHIMLSMIFSWYAEDFAAMGGVAGVLERYLDPGDARRAAAIAAAREDRIEYMRYDWAINAGSRP